MVKDTDSMVNFTPEELEYIRTNFEDILNSTDKETVVHRQNLDADTLENMKFITKKFSKVNEDEKTNKILQDTVYWGLGMYAFVEDGILKSSDLEDYLADDELYCSLFDKIMEAC